MEASEGIALGKKRNIRLSNRPDFVKTVLQGSGECGNWLAITKQKTKLKVKQLPNPEKGLDLSTVSPHPLTPSACTSYSTFPP